MLFNSIRVRVGASVFFTAILANSANAGDTPQASAASALTPNGASAPAATTPSDGPKINACKGMRIYGRLDNAKIAFENLDSIKDSKGKPIPEITFGDSYTVSAAYIKSATVGGSGTCSVAKSQDGAVKAVALSKANLTDVSFDEAIFKDPASKKEVATGLSGQSVTLTAADVKEVSILPPKDAVNDPLDLKKGVHLNLLTDVSADEQVLPAHTQLFYADGANGRYTLYTIDSACSGWGKDAWWDMCGRPHELSNKTFHISASELKGKYALVRWTSGILVVPYKIVPATHNLANGSVTVGPYLGYTTDVFGSEMTWAMTAGIASIPVPTVQNGVTTNSTKAGLTIAAGFMFSPGSANIKSGFLVGIDSLGPNSGYIDNGKPWFGFYVGGGFDNGH